MHSANRLLAPKFADLASQTSDLLLEPLENIAQPPTDSLAVVQSAQPDKKQQRSASPDQSLFATLAEPPAPEPTRLYFNAR